MLNINPKFIEGRRFYKNDPAIEYVCVGQGTGEVSFVVGSRYDAVKDETKIDTFKLREVTFIGDITSLGKQVL